MRRISKVMKKSPVWFVAILCSVVSLLFLLYSPFQKNLFPESVVKRIYYVDNISPAHMKIITMFNEKYKGKIEVVPVNLPFYNFTTNDRKEILTRSLRSTGDGIDIFAVDLIWIPRFAKWAYPLNNLVDKKILAEVNEKALGACYLNDSLVAFPLYLDEGVLYYRRDIIRGLPDGAQIEKRIQRGLTWDEFLSLGKRFRAGASDHSSPANPFYVFTGGEFEGMLCCFQDMLSNDESELMFNPHGDRRGTGVRQVELNTPPARRALRLMVDLIQNYRFSPFDVTRFDEYNSYLYANSHNAVFLRGWVGYRKQYGNSLADTLAMSEMEIAPLPHFAGHTTSSVFGGWSLMVSKFSNRKEEAAKFVDFMFRKENQQILYDDGGYLPINNEVYYDSTFIASHPELTKLRSLLSWCRHRPFLENYTSLSEIMAKYFHQALRNEITVNDALVSATRQINTERSDIK